jgi:hypothetical protein
VRLGTSQLSLSNRLPVDQPSTFATKRVSVPQFLAALDFLSCKQTNTERHDVPELLYEVIGKGKVAQRVHTNDDRSQDHAGKKDIYPITKWTPYEVVAAEKPGIFGCSSVTITITRKRETALWVEQPINQTKPECLKSETKIYK